MSDLGHQRRFRFGLRTLLVATAVVCVLFATFSQPLLQARNQRRVIAQVEELGASISRRATLMRDPTIVGTILGYFGNEYDRDYIYGIDLSGTSVTDQDLVLLQRLPFVFDLDLSGTKVTDVGIDSITTWTNLYELNLSNTQVTDAGILRLKPLQKLTLLKTEHTAVTYSALTELDALMPWANFAEQRAIREIQAFGGQAPDTRKYFETTDYPGMETLTGGETLSFGNLILGMNRKLQLGPAEISHLAHLESLENLNIHDITIAPGSFAELPTISNLRVLEISQTDITDLDMQALARQQGLEELSIYDNRKVTDTGISELAKLHKLKILKVKACENVTTISINYVRQKLPDCEVSFSK